MFLILWFREGYTERLFQKVGAAHDLTDEPRNDYWTCFSWKSCLEQLEIDADVVFIGDSITRGGNFQGAFPDMKIVNLGISGDSINGICKRIDMIESVSPEKIFIEGGINGLSLYTVQQNIDFYEKLLLELKEMYPNTDLYVQGILPVNENMDDNYNKNEKISEVNTGVSGLCADMDIEYIDLYNVLLDEEGQLPEKYTVDGIHLTNDAYEIWFEYIREYIYE